MDDATIRAREVIGKWGLALHNIWRKEKLRDWRDLDDDLDDLATDLSKAGFAIIDTRTHAAVPREPSEADVSRIASVLFMCGPDMTFHDQARAAIAALVAAQTQGGERDPPG